MQHKKDKRKPPDVLRRPIVTSSNVKRQQNERITAVYAHFGINQRDENGASLLILEMARALFPSGFRTVPRSVPRTKRPVWTYHSKLHLVECMENFTERGMTQEEAAAEYIRRYCPERSSAKGLVAEWKRIEKWKQNWDLSDFEMNEITDMLAERYYQEQMGK